MDLQGYPSTGKVMDVDVHRKANLYFVGGGGGGVRGRGLNRTDQ